MIQKEILRQVVVRQKDTLKLGPETIKRDILTEISKWMDDNRVIILTGVRRCGKSTLLKQLMAITKRWGYMNFEDERLLDFTAEHFEMLNEVLVEIYGETDTYFFDEIQNIEKFETFVRRLQDGGKKVVITGSNASLLSREFGTRLTGRYKSFEIYPFSFQEYLDYLGISVEKEDYYKTNKKVLLLKSLKDYMELGGFPEYLKNRDNDYIKTLFDNILYRDIITRYSIKKERVIRELVNFLATNNASNITYNSLKDILNLSNAITVKEYISYLENSYLFFELPRFSYSIKRQLASPKKVYMVDQAFHHVCGINFTPNKGKGFENLVYLELRRRGHEIYSYQGSGECDFVIKDGRKISSTLQVCFSLDKSNTKREVDGLLEAMDEFNLNEGIILTFEQNDEIKKDGKVIRVLSFIQWALGI